MKKSLTILVLFVLFCSFLALTLLPIFSRPAEAWYWYGPIYGPECWAQWGCCTTSSSTPSALLYHSALGIIDSCPGGPYCSRVSNCCVCVTENPGTQNYPGSSEAIACSGPAYWWGKQCLSEE